MKRKEIAEKIRTILITTLQHQKFEMRDDLSATDVDGWDSLTQMIIITEIENTFAIKFKLKELNKMRNLGEMIEMISSKL
jgi:acyl carrier protein